MSEPTPLPQVERYEVSPEARELYGQIMALLRPVPWRVALEVLYSLAFTLGVADQDQRGFAPVSQDPERLADVTAGRGRAQDMILQATLPSRMLLFVAGFLGHLAVVLTFTERQRARGKGKQGEGTPGN